MHARAGVDLLLPVVRHVVDEAADHRVGQQARRWQPLSMICGGGRLLHQQLAALARPLAADVPVHEELRRHDVQPLADVLAHAHHRLAALRRRAAGVLGLDALVHARQVRRQCLALGLAALLVLGALAPGAPSGVLLCRAASWASRLAWSAAKVSSKISRCSAFMRSVLAPNFQAFSRGELEGDASRSWRRAT